MKSKWSKSFSVLQRVGQSLMIPVSVLPAAGLLVAIGRMMGESPVGKVFYSGGLAIFEQLSLIFAVGVAIGFTSGAGVAGLAAAAGYFTLTNVLKVMGEVQGLSMPINMGVFGGIITGMITAQLYNRYSQTKLPAVLGFFSGKRLVPIVTVGSMIVCGVGFGFVWPGVQESIHAFGNQIMGSTLGPSFYAAIKRLLIPVGLHHVYYPPFLYEFGTFVTESGKVLHGEATRYFAGDPTAGRFMASEFPMMLFGLPAAALAMTLRAPKHKRAAVGGVMLSAALTSILTGITEPIEFAFIFVAPVLFVFHVLAAFVSGLLTTAFEIHLGYTFSASIIDFGLGYFNQQNSSMLFLIVGPLVAAMYFSAFYWGIPLFNLKTPGREDDASESAVGTSNNVILGDQSRPALVLKALGGRENILAIDACITRLRLSVANPVEVDEAKLKALGATGILNAGGGNIQVIFGVESEHLKEDILRLMNPVRGVAKGLVLKAAMSGRVLSLDQVPDQTFSQKLIGDGFAIEPVDGMVRSPVTGRVVQVFRTQHAIGIESDEGVEVLIHVGLDTVQMNGRGFKARVEEGARVQAGDVILEVDLDEVRKAGKSTITPIIITNMDRIDALEMRKEGLVKGSDDVLQANLNQ